MRASKNRARLPPATRKKYLQKPLTRPQLYMYNWRQNVQSVQSVQGPPGIISKLRAKKMPDLSGIF